MILSILNDYPMFAIDLFNALSKSLLAVLLVPISLKLSDHTTIGNSIKFGEWVEKLTEDIKNENHIRTIKNFSYSKLLTCTPCHSFWINFLPCCVFAFATCDTIKENFMMVASAFLISLYPFITKTIKENAKESNKR